MARRKNPWATFAIFLGVVGFGFASWHFLYERKMLSADTTPTPPVAEIERLRRTIDDALSDDECYQGIVSFNWREQTKRYRIDLTMRDGCERDKAKRLCARVSAIVTKTTEGADAEVGCLVLGREVYLYVP